MKKLLLTTLLSLGVIAFVGCADKEASANGTKSPSSKCGSSKSSKCGNEKKSSKCGSESKCGSSK